MATAQIVPALTETQVIKHTRVLEPEYVELKLTPEEASSLTRLAMAAVCWSASGEFGQRIKAIHDALVVARIPEESGLVVADCRENLPNGRCYPLQRTWGKRV